MSEEIQTQKRRVDKRLILPTLAIVVLAIVGGIFKDANVPLPFKILIRLFPTFGIVWWARVKYHIENLRDELYRRIFLEAASTAFVVENLVLITYAQLQREKVVEQLDLTLFWYGLMGLWLIIYLLIRRRYISRAESN